MKKKFLSLMMAAAVVATTSVSAFATDYNEQESKVIEHNVTITGDVANNDGQYKPGTIQVTIPTSTAFKVDQTGKFTTGNIVVNNRGTQKIDVLAYRFVDTNGNDGISIKAKNEVVTATPQEVNRTDISLSVRGNQGTVHLKSEDKGSNKSGIYLTEALSNDERDGHLISSILAGGNDTLSLIGEAGKKPTGVDQAVQDAFTLTLKIKKSTN